MSALDKALQLKEELLTYRDELMGKIKEFPKLRLELYNKMLMQLQQITAAIEWKIIEVAGQYMLLPFTSVEIKEKPGVAFKGSTFHLVPPYSAYEKDVIMPDPLRFDVEKIKGIKDLDTEMIIGTFLYREVPVGEGGDVCNTRACYLFATVKHDSWYDETEDPRIACTNEWGCRPTVLFAGGKGIAIFELDKWIGGKQHLYYVSESWRFGAWVWSGRGKFRLLYRSSTSVPAPDEFMSMATFILPIYCNPDTQSCDYPRCLYSESCPDGYKEDVEFMGIKLPIDTYVAIVKFANAQLIPFAVAMGGVYPDEESVVNVYTNRATQFIPAEIYSIIKPVIHDYPVYHVVPPGME